MDEFKVLFHVSDNESWKKALKNIENFLKDFEEGITQIEVVANAAAVLSYYPNAHDTEIKPEFFNQMSKLSTRGVKFVACRNALAAHELDEKLLPPFVQGVSGGITELVIKQKQGYAYIKP